MLPPRLVIVGALMWLAPLCGVRRPETKLGEIVLNLELGEYLLEWTTTPRSPKELHDEEQLWKDSDVL